MKRKKWVILDKNARWWKNSGDVEKWVIKDNNDDYWIVGGSEFPEKKIKPTKSSPKEDDISLIRVLFLVFLISILGVSLGIALISFILP